ncbi:MAG: nucleoside deaminase [Clostridia bacterium]|nr:nucleoside deaminase [Clostridia bacterium]
MNPETFMREALAEAAKAAELGEVPIGAVVVRNGEIVGRGHNGRESERNALAHAELRAIDDACRTLGGWRLFECDLYVTLEPCPMCAGAIINSRIRTVYFGATDPKAGSCGSITNLFTLPYNHQPELYGGVLQEECASVLTQFFRDLRAGRRASPGAAWKVRRRQTEEK